MLGFDVWGRHVSGTVGLGRFGDPFGRTESNADCVDCGRGKHPVGIAQFAHVWWSTEMAAGIGVLMLQIERGIPESEIQFDNGGPAASVVR